MGGGACLPSHERLGYPRYPYGHLPGPRLHTLFLKPRLRFRFDRESQPDTYRPKVSIYAKDINTGGEPITTRRYLTVEVLNRGFVLATGCEAHARLVRKERGCSGSEEPKALRWEPGVIQQSISPGGKKLLNVVFSDEKAPPLPGGHCPHTDDPRCHACIATPDSVGMAFGRLQDILCEGVFEVEVTVACDQTRPRIATFKVEVSRDWRLISMAKVREGGRL